MVAAIQGFLHLIIFKTVKELCNRIAPIAVAKLMVFSLPTKEKVIYFRKIFVFTLFFPAVNVTVDFFAMQTLQNNSLRGVCLARVKI